MPQIMHFLDNREIRMSKKIDNRTIDSNSDVQNISSSSLFDMCDKYFTYKLKLVVYM